jgi:lipopolysaccharide biosynthesis protein
MFNKIRPIAFYLPQYHPIPENDQWWGKGFTEWRNVTKAVPLFRGHYQPHLPSDFGFYDLRLSEIIEQQAQMAREYGIYGFMFYHYWFNGRRMLEAPVNNFLKNQKPDFPFCFCWANENWSRNWDGQLNDILLKQEYSQDDDIHHMLYLCRSVFSDDRYIKIEGKPVFAVYRTESFPDIKKTAEIWKTIAINEGYPDLYLLRVESFVAGIDPNSLGFDAAIEFQPDWNNLPERLTPSFKSKLISFLNNSVPAFKGNHVYLYNDLIKTALSEPIPDYKRFPGITPMWDNSARRKNDAFIFHEASPEHFSLWLKEIIKRYRPFSQEENFIFINAWNEWAEGCHLEPCLKWDKQYLQVLKNIMINNE